VNKKINGIIKATASVSLAGGILAMAAGPAFAAAPNQSDAAAASGVISINPPLAQASSSGPSPVTLAHIDVAGLLTARLVSDRADDTSASSTIADASINLAPLVTMNARVISSSCAFDPNTDTVSGSAAIADVTIGGAAPLTVAAKPAVNTSVTLPGIATITFDRQTVATDGTLTVDAVYIDLLNGVQTITLGTSTCNDATLAPVSILPGMATPIGLGTLGLLTLGGAGYYFARRRRVTVAA
jgi:hypothetical protein